ncbi:MAG TPA: YMGG-like glycine zipper-containing protein [Gemmatimonadaceae bacterium]
MSRSLVAGLLALSLVACHGAEGKDLPGDSGAATASSSSAAASSTSMTLGSGTSVAATIQDGISSRTNRVGQHVNAVTSSDVVDADGHTVIPGGSAIVLTITRLGPAKNSGQADGAIALEATSVTVNGTSYDLSASVGAVPHTLKGEGITKSVVGNVAVGTAVGALVGQVIGKNQKSTIIGGAVGAVAGGARAATIADRDVIVTPGAPITLTLTQSLTISAK